MFHAGLKKVSNPSGEELTGFDMTLLLARNEGSCLRILARFFAEEFDDEEAAISAGDSRGTEQHKDEADGISVKLR